MSEGFKAMNKIDVLAKLNPGMTAVLAKEDELAGDANDTSAGFEQMRLNYVASRQYWIQGGPVMAETVDEQVDGPHGPIAVRYYYPVATRAELIAEGAFSPAIVYAHGGGFVLGDLETHDRICRVLAEKVGVPVAAVDYRLSPEAKFPSAVQEVAAVAKYVHDNGARLGIDGARLGFAGDSGGAHLGLAATMYLRGEMGGSEFVKCLLLFYGWYGLADSASQRLLGGPWDGLTESEWLWYKDLYAEDVNELQTSPYANLLLNDMTHDMPACYIAAAEFDPLRDDSSALAAICEEHGIPHRYEMFEGVIHAFLHYARMLDEANDALEHAATFFRQQLGL